MQHDDFFLHKYYTNYQHLQTFFLLWCAIYQKYYVSLFRY